MAKTDELKIWNERLARADRKFKTQMDKLDLYMQYYRSIHWHDSGKDSDAGRAYGMYHFHPVDNMLYANIRTIVPRLNFRNPKIFVTPRKKPYRSADGIVDTTSMAVGIEILLNYWYKHLKSKREARRCLFDALIAGYGVMEVGFTLKTEKIASKGKNKGDLMIVDELIKSESPYMVRRSPKDVRWDTDGKDSSLADARWISLDWVRDIDDVKADPRFKGNTAGLKTNFTVQNEGGTSREDQSDNPEIWKKVKGRDIWDKKTMKVYTVVEGHDKFLRKGKWPEFYDGAFPIETLFFNEHPDESIPIADFDIYKKAQDELNQMRSITLDHMRRISQRRVFVGGDAMDEDAMRHYEHGGDGTIVKVSNVDQIKNASDPTISQDMYTGQNQMRSSIREMSGVSPTEALATTNFEQATEPALLERAATTIREDQRDTFEDFLVRNVKKLAQVLQQNMPDTDIPLNVQQFEDAQKFVPSKLHSIVGDEDTIVFPWLTLTKRDIEGDYDFDIEVGSTQAVNAETRKQDIVQINTILAGSPLINQREAHERILEAFNQKDTERLLKSDEEVQQDQAQEQEAAQQPSPDQQLKTQADLEKTKMKTETSIQTAQIKAQSEQGKTTANLLAASLKGAAKRGNRE